jgi:hypothetical protein
MLNEVTRDIARRIRGLADLLLSLESPPFGLLSDPAEIKRSSRKRRTKTIRKRSYRK